VSVNDVSTYPRERDNPWAAEQRAGRLAAAWDLRAKIARGLPSPFMPDEPDDTEKLLDWLLPIVRGDVDRSSLTVKSATDVRSRTTTDTERVVDPVRGDHYGGMRMQPLEFILANNLDFLAGNVVKYVTRGGEIPSYDRLTDLRKARHYLDLLIQREEEKRVE
jgi:hypothetical protein